MRILFFALLASIATLFASCASEPTGTTIEGTISDAGGMKVFFDKSKLGNSTMVLSQENADESGSFSFSFEEKLDPGIYRLRIGAKKAYLVLDGTESNVKISGDLASIDRYGFDITGSKAAGEFVQTMDKISTRKMGIKEIQDFMKNSDNTLVATEVAVLTIGRPEFASMHSDLSKRLAKDYPDSEYSTEYTNYAKNLERQYAQQMARQRIKVGQPAPNIKLENPDGKEYQLADLKGNVVLLDFWASWCGPCRRANPHVVEIYKKYKDQGFTVFSVSLDGLDSRTKKRLNSEDAIQRSMATSKQRWVQAIEKDKLEWEYHVSELAKWDTQAAKMYGVTGIPKTFLIDRDGNIAAVNPRYNLEEALLKVL